jgi:predicted ester cyclase
MGGTIMRGQNKRVIQRAIEEYLLGQGDDVFRELYAPGCVVAGPDAGESPYGLAKQLDGASLRDQSLLYKSAFPDMIFQVDEIIEEGDRVAARWTVRGADCGNSEARRLRELFELPFSEFSVSGVAFCRVEDGKIAELWQLSDMLTLARCLKLDHLVRAGAD